MIENKPQRPILIATFLAVFAAQVFARGRASDGQLKSAKRLNQRKEHCPQGQEAHLFTRPKRTPLNFRVTRAPSPAGSVSSSFLSTISFQETNLRSLSEPSARLQRAYEPNDQTDNQQRAQNSVSKHCSLLREQQPRLVITRC
jgi:hypothetical protein